MGKILDDRGRLNQPVTTVITITTDHPNSDGHAYSVAKEMYEYFTRKPKYSASVLVINSDGKALLSEEQHGDPPKS